MKYIIWTLGPKSRDKSTIVWLADAGMNVARINFSHAQYDVTERIVGDITEYNKNSKNRLLVMLDTKWPEIRTVLEQPTILLEQWVPLLFSHSSFCGEIIPPGAIVCDYPYLHDVQVGVFILLDSGLCTCVVREQTVDGLLIEPLHTHTIWPRKHINIPDIKVHLPILNEKDQQDISRGIVHGIDIFAISFTRNAMDVDTVRQYIREQWGAQPVRSKIENREAIHHAEEIVRASDGVIVARGDLAIEIGYEKVPYYQEQIVALAKKYNKPVIVWTQCIESMQTSILPTRAEVHDIYQHVRMWADGLLLANEIAIGNYPVLTIETVMKIIDFAKNV